MNKKEDQSEHQHSGMGKRGVTRPMAEMEPHHNGQEGHGAPYSPQREEMLHMHYSQTLWIYWTLMILGIWVLLSPFTFDYAKELVAPAGGRDLWLTGQQRVLFMKWSDIISGALLIFFSWRSLTPNRPVSLWICCFIGIWLSMAPVIFWAPSAAAYLNGTLTGALVIALSILVPGMPNMIMYMKMGSETPPGWTYNPSSWPQRWIMIVTGFLGWIVSRYLAAYQMGYTSEIWDPFFGEGSSIVLTSEVSHSLPVSDGALGALAYTFEFLMGYMGSPSRWRTMPWMVTFFGILVIPLGLVHIILVISQPVLVGHWCTFCLLAAAIMLPMIPLEVDEVIAMAQHVRKRMQKGDSFWKVFWKGGAPIENNRDERSPELVDFPKKPLTIFKSSIWGMSFPWTLSVSAIFGIALMFAPGVLNVVKPASDVFHLGGALMVVVSVICMGEVIRAGRYLNILLGLIVAGLPWLMNGSNLTADITGLVIGLAVALLAFRKGPQKEKYGTWDKLVV